MQSNTSVISPSVLREMVDHGERVHLVDVRTPAEYRDAHATGAISVPLDGLDVSSLTVRLGNGAGTRETLHLICESGNRAEQAAERLQGQGLHNLMVVDGGTQSWAANRLPMQRQSRRLSLERQTQIALGVLILLMLAKGTLLHPLFYALIGLLGVGLIAAGITARCGLAAIMSRMPWNRSQPGHPASA